MNNTAINHYFTIPAQTITLGQVIYHAVSIPECKNSFSIQVKLEPVTEYVLDSISYAFHELSITIQGLCTSLRKRIRRLPLLWHREVLKVKQKIYVFICKFRC